MKDVSFCVLMILFKFSKKAVMFSCRFGSLFTRSINSFVIRGIRKYPRITIVTKNIRRAMREDNDLGIFFVDRKLVIGRSKYAITAPNMIGGMTPLT